MNPLFITQNELAREISVPVSRITAAIESGIISPAGRAGNHKHSAIVFDRADIERIAAAIRMSGRARATATATKPHICRDADEVRAKAAALSKARKEAGK